MEADSSMRRKNELRSLQRQRSLINVSTVAKDNYGYVVARVAKDRGFESHGIAVMPNQRMRILQIQEPAETVGAGLSAQRFRHIFGEFCIRARRQFRGSNRREIFRNVSPRSARQPHSRNCCTPIWFPARISRAVLFRAAAKLPHREFVFPATRFGLSFFPPRPLNLRNRAARQCGSANREQ